MTALKEKTEHRLDMLKYSIIATFIVMFFIIAAAVLFYNCSTKVKQEKAIDGGITATAKVVKVETRSHSSSSYFYHRTTTTYYASYEYIDGNGIKYSGLLLDNPYSTYESAAQRIGEEITIYIDGKGTSIPKGEKTNYKACLVFGIIMSVLGIGVGIYGYGSIIAINRGRKKAIVSQIIIDEADYSIEMQDEETK